MSRPVAPLVTAVLSEGSFDATEPQALGWLNSRHELLCARSKCYRRQLQVGPTVAGQAEYPIPAEVVEIREVRVTSSAATGSLGVPYGAALHSDLAQGALGYLWLGGLYLRVGGGIYVRDSSSEGADQLALFPTPEESGLPVTLLAVCRPEPLALTQGGALVAGQTGTFRFCSTTRGLTAPELATYVSGGGLPAGVGTDNGATSFELEYQLPGAAWVTVTATKDAVGAYHALVLTPTQGVMSWRGKGLNGSTVVWETPLEEATVEGAGGLKTPPEFDDALVAGAMATALARVEARPDLAAPFEQQFAAACLELAGQVNRRYRGSGPATVRVRGINAS